MSLKLLFATEFLGQRRRHRKLLEVRRNSAYQALLQTFSSHGADTM
jgi:hypothetical protein